MTPTQVEEAARRRYNSVGDSFWSPDEIYQLLYDACLEASREALLIERTYSTTTVAGTQEYSYPTNTIAVKRVTYNGKKLKPITMREDDTVTDFDMATTSQGTPLYYFQWNYTLALRPTPDAAQTLKIWSYNAPSTISTTSTLEIPTEFHMDLVKYIVKEMAAKDQNYKAAEYWGLAWDKAMKDMKVWAKKRRRTDSFANVQDEEAVAYSYLGVGVV